MEFSGLGVLLSHIRDLFLEWEELPAVVRWFSTGLIILFIEYQFPTLFILWFALGAFITSLVAIFIPEFLLLQMFVFVVSSFVFLTYRREIINLLTPGDVLGFFTHELVGKKGICSKATSVKSSDCLVRINGIEWTAISLDEDIEMNEKVLIIGRKDHTLFIEPWDHDLSKKVKKHRHLIRKRFPVTQSSEVTKGIIIDGRTFNAKSVAGGREIMNGEMVEIIAIGRKNVIVDLKEKDFLLPRDIIGKVGTAKEAFGKRKNIGSIKIDGVVWNSESLSNLAINKGDKVRVVQIDGLKLMVEAVNEHAQIDNVVI